MHLDDISIIIPYLASKFSRDHYKRMQVNLVVGHYSLSKIGYQNLDLYQGLFPKHL